MHQTPRPDLVVLDLMMPKMGGWTLRMHQRRDPDLGKIPVVVVCSLPGKLDEDTLKAVFTKPLYLLRFLDVIKGEIERGESSSEPLCS
jgi:CheY-like chemotaxis protein